MPAWTFRLKGQFHFVGGFPYADYRGQSVRGGVVNGRPVVELMESNYDLPRATFELDSIFGFIVSPGSTIRVWRRNPTAVGECAIDGLIANFARPGTLSKDIETWDLLQRENDPNGPLGRVLAQWVSEVSRGA